VVRMGLVSLALTDELPFERVRFHGMLRGHDGRIMQKRHGNVIDPLEEVEREGAGPLRFALALVADRFPDIRFSAGLLKQGHRFVNKLWNVYRFVREALGEAPPVVRALDVAALTAALERLMVDRTLRRSLTQGGRAVAADELLELGHVRLARLAPGGPVLHDDVLAAVGRRGQVGLAAAEGRALQRDRLADRIQPPQRPGRFLAGGRPRVLRGELPVPPLGLVVLAGGASGLSGWRETKAASVLIHSSWTLA